MLTPEQHVAFGWGSLVGGAAFVTVLIVEKVRKSQTPRTATWTLLLVASILWFGLGVVNLMRW